MENEEKRELPEGVKEETGACIFCGQAYMFANVGLSTEQLNEAATEKCTCEEAKEWQWKRKRAKDVHRKVDKIFSQDKCLDFMQAAAEMVLLDILDKVSVKMSDGTVGNIAQTKKRWYQDPAKQNNPGCSGGIRCMRSL